MNAEKLYHILKEFNDVSIKMTFNWIGQKAVSKRYNLDGLLSKEFNTINPDDFKGVWDIVYKESYEDFMTRELMPVQVNLNDYNPWKIFPDLNTFKIHGAYHGIKAMKDKPEVNMINFRVRVPSDKLIAVVGYRN